MTAAELERQARAIVPPVGASVAIAVHDGTHHRAAFLVNGRIRSAPVGPAFAKPSDAIAFVHILNGERPATRPGHSDLARLGPDRRDASGQPESPDQDADGSPSLPGAVPPAAPGNCVVCGRPLPRGSRSHRRTDSATCRRALARREAHEAGADAQGGSVDVPLSGGSDAPSPAEVLGAHVQDVIGACNPDLRSPDPTSPAGPRGYALRGSAEGAGPLDSPGPPGLDVLPLGL